MVPVVLVLLVTFKLRALLAATLPVTVMLLSAAMAVRHGSRAAGRASGARRAWRARLVLAVAVALTVKAKARHALAVQAGLGMS